jgi:DNA-directed RNA polymerase specialized sigma24 family protein
VPSAEEIHAELTAQYTQEHRLHCLSQCLHKLPEEDRLILLEYHQGQGQAKIARRQALAARLGITAGSLRNRTSRIRDRMAVCIRACAGKDV